jgi:hypothetical protein
VNVGVSHGFPERGHARGVNGQSEPVMGSPFVTGPYLAAAIRRRWRLWASTAVAGVLAAIALSVASPPSYTATTTVRLGHAPEADATEEMRTDEELLKTTTVARGAVERLGLSEPATALCKEYGGQSVSPELLQVSARGRTTADAVRLIDSTSLRLSSLSAGWATYSAEVFGAKAHIVYDPLADRPVYFAVTPAKVNDITVAQVMPTEPGTTYVYDLGYYDYGWWAKLDDAGCRFVTRLKKNTPLTIVHESRVPANGNILSDRIGHLPQRLARSRRNPLQVPVRELRVMNETGKILRIVTNDLDAPAQEIADLYKQRWQIELFFRWVKQTLRIKHFLGTSENAVRIQIAVALIAFVLLRLAQAAQKAVPRPLDFARLVRSNLMHRRSLDRLLEPPPPVPRNRNQLTLALYFQ